MAVFRDVAEAIRENIREGEYWDGQLPTQLDLANEFAVGLATIQRALDVLKKDGTIYTTHKGTFVGPRPGEEGGGINERPE